MILIGRDWTAIGLVSLIFAVGDAFLVSTNNLEILSSSGIIQLLVIKVCKILLAISLSISLSSRRWGCMKSGP